MVTVLLRLPPVLKGPKGGKALSDQVFAVLEIFNTNKSTVGWLSILRALENLEKGWWAQDVTFLISRTGKKTKFLCLPPKCTLISLVVDQNFENKTQSLTPCATDYNFNWIPNHIVKTLTEKKWDPKTMMDKFQ